MNKDLNWAERHNLTILQEEDLFGEFLDEAYGDVSIAGLAYSTSYALKDIDPIAYRQEMLDYIDSVVQEGAIHQLEDGTLIAEDPDTIQDEVEEA